MRYLKSLLSLFSLVSLSAFAVEPSTLFGLQTYDSYWDLNNDPRMPFTAFDLNEKTSTVVGEAGYADAAHYAGAMANGTWWLHRHDGTWNAWWSQLTSFDFDTFSSHGSASTASGYSDESVLIIDMAYDWISGTLYGVTSPGFNNRQSSQFVPHLVKINPINASIEVVAQLSQTIYALACDAQGQLWGVGVSALFKISPDGLLTRVGDHGFFVQSVEQSMTFDIRSGRLFWAIAGATSAQALYTEPVYAIAEIDLSSGKATPVMHFGHTAYYVGLSVDDAHPFAPDYVTDLSFKTTEPGSTKTRLSFNAPSLTYSQKPLLGALDINILLDGSPYKTITLNPGESYSEEVPFDEATLAEFTVFVSRDGLNGPKSNARYFVGPDAPAAPANLNAATNPDHSAVSLSWDPVTLSAHGADLPDGVLYDVWRAPSNRAAKRVAQDLAETSFTDNVEADWGYCRYYVVAHINNLESDKTYSRFFAAGRPLALPFDEEFIDAHAFNRWSPVDADNNGYITSGGEHCLMWSYDSEYSLAWYYGLGSSAANDWLISPALNFDDDHFYRLSFDLGGEVDIPIAMEVSVGALPDEASQAAPFSAVTTSARYPNLKTFYADFYPGASNRFIGFHNVSGPGNHSYLDNISVSPAGLASAPAAPANLRAEKDPEQWNHAVLRFSMPTKTVNGRNLAGKLTALIYRGYDAPDPIARVEDFPGTSVSWTHKNAIAGINEYRVTILDASGEAGPEAAVSINLVEDVPGEIPAIDAHVFLQDAVQIQWTAPVDASPTTYYIVDRYSSAGIKRIADNLDKTSFIDDNPLDGVTNQQEYVYYAVTPYTSGGAGSPALTPLLLVGKPYALPFVESWSQMMPQAAPWKSSGDAQVAIRYSGYDPYAPTLDGAGMITFYIDNGSAPANGSYISPMIDLSNVSTAVASFFIYRSDVYSDDAVAFLKFTSADSDVPDLVSEKFHLRADHNSWEQVSVDLTPALGNRFFRVELCAFVPSPSQSVHIDKLQISGSSFESDLALCALSFDSPVVLGESLSAVASVENVGINNVNNASVRLFIDDTQVAVSQPKNIPAGRSVDFSFDFIATPAGTHNLTARIYADDDLNPANNALARTIVIEQDNTPIFNTLRAYEGSNPGSVVLRWVAPALSPNPQRVTDGAENYDHCTIEHFGEFSVADLDGNLPVRFRNQDGEQIWWENCDKPQAWMAVNPKNLGLGDAISTHDGDMIFVAWASPQNNDWLISPELSGDAQILSFWASSLSAYNSGETFSVLVSMDGNDPDDFVTLTGENALIAPADWQQFHFTLPAGARYFAIVYSAAFQTGMALDDICFEGFAETARPDTYDIWRDNLLIVENRRFDANSFLDRTLEPGSEHRYVMQARYPAERRSSLSNEVVIKAASLNVLFENDPIAIYGAEGAIVVVAKPGTPIEVVAPSGVSLFRGRAVASQTTIPANPGFYIVRVANSAQTIAVR